jgi:hypothetical protein
MERYESFPHAHFAAYQNAMLYLQGLLNDHHVEVEPCDASKRNFEDSRVVQLAHESEERIVIAGQEACRLFLRYPAPEQTQHFPGLALGSYLLVSESPPKWLWYAEIKFGTRDPELQPTWRLEQHFDQRYRMHAARPDFGDDGNIEDLSGVTALDFASQLIDFYNLF